MKLYGASDVLAKLEEIVAEYGEDHKYDPDRVRAECNYAEPNGDPSCVAGHVFFRLDPDLFESIREAEATSQISQTVCDIESKYHVELPLTRLASTVLLTAQSRQDSGYSWGVALEEAKKAADIYENIHSDQSKGN